MAEWAIVTGGGTGIGRALARALAARGLQVVIVGRREQPLEETRAVAPQAIHAVAADVTRREGRAAVVNALPAGARLRCLVHNAGVVTPIGPLSEVEEGAWRDTMAINLDAPLFLTQALLEPLRGGRSLHISSGAAHHPYRGWGAYCTSKAGLYMLYQVLRTELEPFNIGVGSVRPGVVDTPMQELIRGQTAERFPDVQRFLDLKREGRLIEPEPLAQFLCWLLLDCDAQTYSQKEWTYPADAPRS